MIQWIWTPILGNGSEGLDIMDDLMTNPQSHPTEGPYRPDIPGGVTWHYDDSLIEDLTVARRSPPAHTFMRVGVDEADLPKVRARVEARQVPEKDRLLNEMVRSCRDDWDGRAEMFFDNIEGVASSATARKAVLKEVLVQGVTRGLSPVRAERIRASKDLASSTKTSSIDTDLYNAALSYTQRTYNYPKETAKYKLDTTIDKFKSELLLEPGGGTRTKTSL